MNKFAKKKLFEGGILSFLGLTFGGPGVGIMAALGTLLLANKDIADEQEYAERMEKYKVKPKTAAEIKTEEEEKREAREKINEIFKDAPILYTQMGKNTIFDIFDRVPSGVSIDEFFKNYEPTDRWVRLHPHTDTVKIYHNPVAMTVEWNSDSSFGSYKKEGGIVYYDERKFYTDLYVMTEKLGREIDQMYKLKGLRDEGRWMYKFKGESCWTACW